MKKHTVGIVVAVILVALVLLQSDRLAKLAADAYWKFYDWVMGIPS